MSYKCSGVKNNGTGCKNKVDIYGGYCRYHVNQREAIIRCNCMLENGSDCPYPAKSNGFCQFHIDPVQCQGKTSTGSSCLKAIPNGKYCCKCKDQADVITDEVKNSINKTRNFICKDSGPIIPSKKTAVVIKGNFDGDIALNIPKELQKVDIEKPADCVICLEEFENTKHRKLTCGHYFHEECLSKTSSLTCPICRKPINENCIPRWISSRIHDNIAEDKIKRRADARQATRDAIVAIIQNDLLDINSSEEDDLDIHISNNSPMAIGRIVDERGDVHYVVIAGESP